MADLLLFALAFLVFERNDLIASRRAQRLAYDLRAFYKRVAHKDRFAVSGKKDVRKLHIPALLCIKFFDQDYAIKPEWLPSGATGATVDVIIRFAVQPGGFRAGGIYGLRILPAN